MQEPNLSPGEANRLEDLKVEEVIPEVKDETPEEVPVEVKTEEPTVEEAPIGEPEAEQVVPVE
jgi:hypothetical protein